MTTFNALFTVIIIIIIVLVPKPNTKLFIYNFIEYTTLSLDCKSSSFNQNQL